MTMKQDWWEFHRENPEVYELFKRFAFEAARVRDHYSSDAIVHRIRWYTAIETQDHTADFKINNNWTPYYGRLFMVDFPEHEGFFRTRLASGVPGTEPVGGQRG